MEHLQPVSLQYGIFRFTTQAMESGVLPSFKGSTLRGGLGAALRNSVCTRRQLKSCGECREMAYCVYAYLFETLSKGFARDYKFEHMAHPYVIDANDAIQTDFAPGDVLTFNLILLERGLNYLHFFIEAFRRACGQGFGADRTPFKLIQVEQLIGDQDQQVVWQDDGGLGAYSFPQPQIISSDQWQPEELKQVEVHFLTQLRLMEKGRLVQVPQLPTLMRTVFRRLDFILKVHGNRQLSLPFHHYLDLAEQSKIDRHELIWQDMSRYSNRQKKQIKLGGLVGQIVYAGDGLNQLFPYLKIAELFHVGKGTVFGLGKLKVEYRK